MDPVLFQNSAQAERLKYQRISASSRQASLAAPERFGLDEFRDIDTPLLMFLVMRDRVPEPTSGPVSRLGRLGGILSHYYREAA